jgi:MFS family permease
MTATPSPRSTRHAGPGRPTRPGETPERSRLPRSGRLFHGWKVAISGALILALQSTLVLQAFGSYAVVLQDRFGWSKTTFSIAYAFNRAESGLLGPVHGWAVQRFGTRRVIRLGAVILIIGFLWFSQVSSPLWFIVSFFVIAVGASFSGFLTVTSETVRWFERKRSRALSVLTLGISAGGLAAPLVVVALTQLGWRTTAALSGLIMGALLLVLSRFYGSSPADLGVAIDNEPSPAPDVDRSRNGRVATEHLTAQQALRTPAFWYLAFGHASALLVVGSIIAHLSLYLTQEQGFTLQGASFVLAGITIAQMLGMLLGGILGDRFDKRWLCSMAMIGHVSGLLLLTFATSNVMIWAFVALHGFAWGARGPLMSAIRADYFGATAFAQIMGYTSLILMFGMVGGPLLAGVLADTTGSYRTGFTILAALAATGSVLFALARPPSIGQARHSPADRSLTGASRADD